MRTQPVSTQQREAIASGFKTCGTITFISIAALATLAAIPTIILGALKWKNAAPGSSDLALGKLLVGLGAGVGTALAVSGCLCTMVSVAKQGAGGA